jgi:hypothetical protein
VCVNELQREARQKLFSYAVAALSNFQVLRELSEERESDSGSEDRSIHG